MKFHLASATLKKACNESTTMIRLIIKLRSRCCSFTKTKFFDASKNGIASLTKEKIWQISMKRNQVNFLWIISDVCNRKVTNGKFLARCRLTHFVRNDPVAR